MKYIIPQAGQSGALDTYRVSSGDELTLVAWKLERRRLPYGLNWRSLCSILGVVDPMQVAHPLGQDERFLLGERLRIGQELAVL